ncbi:MAG: HEAT repeat domain-containing protein [bacterium JZ-2024 1]
MSAPRFHAIRLLNIVQLTGLVAFVLMTFFPGVSSGATDEEMEELYQTAALWEVGTNRDRVRDAREKLIAMGEEAVNFIVERHLGYTESLEMRAVEEVFKGLKHFAGPRLVEVLKMENEETYRLRNTFYLCGTIEWGGCVPELQNWLSRHSHLSGRALRALIGAIGTLKAQSAVPQIASFLEHPDDMVVVTTAHALKTIGDPSSVPWLLKRLETGNLVRRTAAEDALIGFGRVARKAVLERLKKAEQDPRVLAHYLNIIARIQLKGDYEAVRPYLKHPDERVRGYAVRATIVTGGDRARKYIERLKSGETSPFVVGEMERAIVTPVPARKPAS